MNAEKEFRNLKLSTKTVKIELEKFVQDLSSEDFEKLKELVN